MPDPVTTGAGGVPVAAPRAPEFDSLPTKGSITALFGALNLEATAHQVAVVEAWAAGHGIELP
jgi:hypothetical protein